MPTLRASIYSNEENNRDRCERGPREECLLSLFLYIYLPSNRFFLLVILSVPLSFRSSARFPPLSLFFPPLARRDASSFLVRLLNLRARLYIRRYLSVLSCTTRSFNVAQCRANF